MVLLNSPTLEHGFTLGVYIYIHRPRWLPRLAKMTTGLSGNAANSEITYFVKKNEIQNVVNISIGRG